VVLRFHTYTRLQLQSYWKSAGEADKEMVTEYGRYSARSVTSRGELSYLAPLGSKIISAPYFKQCFFRGGGYYHPR